MKPHIYSWPRIYNQPIYKRLEFIDKIGLIMSKSIFFIKEIIDTFIGFKMIKSKGSTPTLRK